MKSTMEKPNIKKELTPEQEAILIQAEFLKAFPGMKKEWTERHAENFRKYFDDNKKLFHELYNDPEKRTDLFQIIYSEVVDIADKK